jgi:hypothetical protein
MAYSVMVRAATATAEYRVRLLRLRVSYRVAPSVIATIVSLRNQYSNGKVNVNAVPFTVSCTESSVTAPELLTT